MQEFEATQIEIRGVDCQNCAQTIERTIIGLEGVEEADVNVISGDMNIRFDPSIISSYKISNTIKSLGYTVGENDKQLSSFKISGMDCADEEKIIRNQLNNVEGIHNLNFDLIGERLTVEHSLSSHAIIQSISGAGFSAELEGKEQKSGEDNKLRKRVILTALSGILIATGAAVSFVETINVPVLPFYIAAMILSGFTAARKAYFAVKTFTLDMNFLMTVAVIGAAFIGEWLEGAMVIFLFSIAELLEAGSLNRAREAIQSLMGMAPENARVILENGNIETVKIDNIGVGEILSVRPGERIPLDGELTESNGYVNQAPITGESIPVEKGEGDSVYAGSINGDSALKIRVTRISSESTLSTIVKLVEEARKNKSPSEKFVDKFSRYYTPSVVAISILMVIVPTLLFSEPFSIWFYRSLVLLVVACPCALVISTPVTIVSGLTRAARSGVLIKGGNILEAMAQVNAVILDKTGTITEGKPEVVDILSLNQTSPEFIMSTAASVESASEHPVAKAVLTAAENMGAEFEKGEKLHNHPGEGTHAIVNGKKVYVGNHKYFEKSGLCNTKIEETLEKIEETGRTAVLVWEEKSPIGIIAVQDVVRPIANQVVTQLRSLGVEKILLLTGDNSRTAAAAAGVAGITDFRGELLPEEKMNIVSELTNNGFNTMMVGDGVNDTPALAAADVGVAMGSAGSDQAIETADVALMSDDLTKLPFGISLAKKSLRIVKENISFAIGIKALFMLMAPFGLATLWMAVAADMGASLIVIANGMRVLRFKG